MEFRTFQKQWVLSLFPVTLYVFASGLRDNNNFTLRLAERDLPMTAVGNGWFQIDVPRDAWHRVSVRFTGRHGGT